MLIEESLEAGRGHHDRLADLDGPCYFAGMLSPEFDGPPKKLRKLFQCIMLFNQLFKPSLKILTDYMTAYTRIITTNVVNMQVKSMYTICYCCITIFVVYLCDERRLPMNRGAGIFDRDRGRRIKVARKRLRLSQSELADKLGVSQQMISKIERGRDFKISLAIKLITVLQISHQYLAGEI